MAQIIVSSGQSSSGLTISGNDSLLVQSGGTVQNTVLQGSENGMGNGPTEEVQGSSIGTQIGSGSQTIDAGGSALSATVGSDGVQAVQNGGSASFTTIQSGGEVDVGDQEADPDAALAVITSATVQSGGELDIYNQGVASGTVVSSGGGLDIAEGGLASGDTILSGGVLLVGLGGSATHETVQAGGLIIKYAGATLTDTNTDGVLAGVVVMNDDDSVVSSWLQSGDATLNNLDLSTLSGPNEYEGLDVFVGGGETVNTLTLNSGMDVDIAGTVNGLTSGYADVFQGGVLTGVISSVEVTNQGGLISGATLTQSASLVNSGGLVAQVTVESGSFVTIGMQPQQDDDDDDGPTLPAAQASGMVVLSGGQMTVLSGASIAGDTISSGGFVYLSAGASASHETIADGGILIREGNTTVSSIDGTLAGLVVVDNRGAVKQVFFQSGSATLSGLTLDMDSATPSGGTVTVGYGETVESLTLTGSSYTHLNIAGTVSGLTAAGTQATLLQGGVLGGTLARSSQTGVNWFSVTNSGGSISGAVLTSGVSLANASGQIDGLTVASGATLSSNDMNMTGVVVQSGGTLRIDSATDIGSAGGVLDIGASLLLGQGISAVESGGSLIVSSDGTVVQTYTLDTSDGTPILLNTSNVAIYGETNYTLAAGQIVSAGQTSSGYVVSAAGVQMVSAGGTSLSTTILGSGQEVVFSGGVASGTIVHSGGTETLSAGGSAVGGVISSYGSEVISAGGSSLQTDILAGGAQNVTTGGTAWSATVETGGTQTVNGGTASGTQVSGYLSVYGGQTVSAVVSGGATENVVSGQAVATTVQSNGQMEVAQHGSAVSAVVETGGFLTDAAGVITGTTVQSGATAQVYGASSYVWSNGSSVGSTVVGSAVSDTVLSGGALLVGSGGRASGDVISSGGYVEVLSGGTVANESVQSGGVIILDNGGTVTGTNTSGVLAGVVVRDGQGSLISAIVQSGDNTVHSLDLTSVGSANVVHRTLVASGETVSGLSIGNSGLYSYQNTLSIGGVVSGLAIRNVNTTILSGGVLEGDVALTGGTNSSDTFYQYTSVENSGGTVSGADIFQNITLRNESAGILSHVTIHSGATLQTVGNTFSDVLVQSGGTIEASFQSGTGQTGGTLDVGAHFVTDSNLSTTVENNKFSLSSSGTLLEQFNIALSSDAQTGETGVLLAGNNGYYTVAEGYVVSAGQTSTGLVVPGSHALEVEAGGTSVDATLSSPASNGSGTMEDVWGSSLSTHVQSQTQQVIHSGGVSLQATIQDHAQQTIQSGGVASGATLSGWFAEQTVQSGGDAVSAVLSGGAQQYVYTGGSALSTTLASGGEEVIYSGAIASGTDIQSGGVTYVYQQATLDGFTVENGGSLSAYGQVLHGTVESGGTLNFLSALSASGGSVLATGVTVDLGAHMTFASGLSGQIENNTLVLTSGGVAVESFALGNLPPNAGGETPLLKEVTSGFQTYYELDDGTPCYCPGTLIATTRGEVAVEDLKIGDRVVTASGKRRPIRWIGNRAYSGRFAATNPDVLPILFRAGSLGVGASGEALPRRDLRVSPLHAMYLEGVLVPAQALVNGTSIVRLTQVDHVAYFHVELKTHDILLAEGAPAESFVDDDSRGMFHNAHEYAERYPRERKATVQYCAPRVEDGAQLEAIRQRLNSLPVARCIRTARAG
ncbi:Hint domain-containing protein [Acetobacter persici]|uniref:Hint domain-containing protein n=1 Tax=Acetobacter persici TaxID=1076596 RepID=UPI001BA9DE19|nr:Hint domain-containing protein [Acetobacter persici]MBS1016332.1 Hint domain-containing protein [Acetobacter persici]